MSGSAILTLQSRDLKYLIQIYRKTRTIANFWKYQHCFGFYLNFIRVVILYSLRPQKEHAITPKWAHVLHTRHLFVLLKWPIYREHVAPAWHIVWKRCKVSYVERCPLHNTYSVAKVIFVEHDFISVSRSEFILSLILSIIYRLI